jgi:hypothetical protein
MLRRGPGRRPAIDAALDVTMGGDVEVDAHDDALVGDGEGFAAALLFSAPRAIPDANAW